MILLRVLAIIVQADNQGKHPLHPLHHPVVNCLTPNYSSGSDPWTYIEDIIYPVQMLQTLGIDIFADLRYDTWVIRTIRNRVRNNVSKFNGSDSVFLCLNPLYSLLNHSCHPNMRWEFKDDLSPIHMYAERDIKRGEELCISYNGDMRFLSRGERQELLKRWFNGGCGCTRCRVETNGSHEDRAMYLLSYMTACSEEERKVLLRDAFEYSSS
jgi:hypothetical protein